MKVLVTGASGTVGREVISQLENHKDVQQVHAFDKPNKKSRKFLNKRGPKTKVFWGDVSVLEDVEEACKGVDAVIHLAAIIPPLADEKPDLAQQINTIGTQNVIKSLEKQSPEAFFMYSSSISVYGDRVEDYWIKTTDSLTPSPRDEYAVTKIESEKIIQSSKLNWTIFRLTAIMGLNNHKPTGLMFHMPLDTKMEICMPEDTATAFAKGIWKQNELNGNIFNLGGGESCRVDYKTFFSRHFSIFGLGELNFPENAFATKNFHCGYYEDGDKLEKILGFRKNSLEDYYNALEGTIPPIQKAATKMVKGIVKKKLASMSEPLAALKKNDQAEIEHYFR